MDSFNVKLDQSHYKGLILGTGMYESLISSALAYKGYSSLNLDQDASYSAAIKTCSVKEFLQLFSSVYPNKKNHIFRVANYETTISDDEKSKLRGFNIDLQPRFLYSSSLTVNKMVEAGMDKYMDFRAISGVFFFDNDSSKFLKVPINKGEIFSSSALSLIEKRKLFKFLHACTTLSKVLNDSETDINSTAEFDKDLKIDENLIKTVLEIKEDHVNKFMDLMGISGKLANLLVYVIANCAYSIEDTKKEEYFLTTHGFITRVEKFIKSMGVHSNYPYLYTNYGTSDIPQGFSRASAVNGSIFILHPQMNFEGISKVEEHTEEAKINFKLKTNLAEGKDHVTSEFLVINKDYIDLLEGFQEGDISFEEKALLRITVLVEDTQKNITTDTPSFYYIFPNTKALGNPSPVFIFATGEKSNSTPANHFIFYVQTIVNEKESTENIKTLEKNLREFIREQLCGNSEYRELASASYVQVRRKFAKEAELTEKGGLVIIDDDNYSLDFDDYFAKAAENMKKLCPENYQLLFQPNGDKKEGETHYAQQAEDDDYEGDNHLNNLLQTLDKFKVENNPVQETAAVEDVQEGNVQEGVSANENAAGSSAGEQEVKGEENK